MYLSLNERARCIEINLLSLSFLIHDIFYVILLQFVDIVVVSYYDNTK